MAYRHPFLQETENYFSQFMSPDLTLFKEALRFFQTVQLDWLINKKRKARRCMKILLTNIIVEYDLVYKDFFIKMASPRDSSNYIVFQAKYKNNVKALGQWSKARDKRYGIFRPTSFFSSAAALTRKALVFYIRKRPKLKAVHILPYQSRARRLNRKIRRIDRKLFKRKFRFFPQSRFIRYKWIKRRRRRAVWFKAIKPQELPVKRRYYTSRERRKHKRKLRLQRMKRDIKKMLNSRQALLKAEVLGNVIVGKKQSLKNEIYKKSSFIRRY
jgi:hypothetical protein